MKFICLVLALAACGNISRPDKPTDAVSMEDLAVASTYMLLSPGGSQCTAWSVNDHYLVSAGHCCDEPGEYTLVNEDLKVAKATVVAAEDMVPNEGAPVDVCVLKTTTNVGPGLPLAPAMPTPGTRMGYVGYPLGEYTIATGEYVGDIDGPYADWDNFASTAPCDHGASGSGLYTEAGAYGVLVRLLIIGNDVLPGEMGCVASPLSQIVAALDTI
jgi:hypothetical protein